MITTKFKICSSVAIAISSIILFFACDDEKVYPETRLFMPVLNEDLSSKDNTIIVNMAKMKKALSYTLEVSRDTFKTVDYTIQTDQNYLVLNSEQLNGETLFWNTLYQVRVVAHAEDSQYDSKPSMLGNVRTAKYPSIMTVPTAADVVDVGARVFWRNEGAPVTAIKVFAAKDLKMATVLSQAVVTTGDQTALTKIIYGLQPGTNYTIAIYSGETLRGYENFKTLAQGPSGPLVIDLRQVTFKESLVTDTIPDIPAGSLVLLKKGKTYVMNGAALELSKSLTFTSGLDFGDNARLHFTGNFNFPTTNPTVDSLVFTDVILTGASIGSNYVGNFSRAGTLKKIKFVNVNGKIFRGLVRTQGGVAITINDYIVSNCVMDSIGNYGMLTVDNVANKVDNITIENSTISKANVFLHSKNNLNTLNLIGCTISETPVQTTGIMFRFSGGAGKNDVTGGITIKDCIWGHGWDVAATGAVTVVGYQGLPATNFNILNTWATSDFGMISGQIPGFPSNAYNNTAVTLWEDPYKEDFDIKDTGFGGKSSAGDPRWRVKL